MADTADTPERAGPTIVAIVVTVAFVYLIYSSIMSETEALWGKVLGPLLLVMLASVAWMRAYRAWRQ
jgi:hypothetical protein